MEIERLVNCTNCGAVLTTNADQTIKCKYCGTVYHQKPQVNDINSSIETEIADLDAQRRWDNMNNGGVTKAKAGWVIVTFIFLFVIIAIVMNEKAGQSQATLSDTVAVDTSMLFVRPQIAKLSEMEQASLKKLAVLDVDRMLFNKLYKNSNVSTLRYAPQDTYVSDKNSLYGKAINGLYIDINYSDIGYLIFFGSQHVNKQPLDLQSLIFTIDDEHLQYEPSFSADTLQHLTNEYSKEVIYDGNISMLLKLATADKVIVRFNGNKGHDQIVLPKDQQDALKRQLQLYKGFLSGYAKQ
ncbi:MAG: hypothetical protein JWQ57_3268 [Mucilaginibacter sp.]|nr:hypothetical protein [Mucilaginibacter sp.]